MPHLLGLIKLVYLVGFFQVVIFTLFRVLFFNLFYDESFNQVQEAFIIGLRLDIQIAVIFTLPLLFLGWIKWINPLVSTFGKYLWTIIFVVLNIGFCTFYVGDIAYYEFFKKRMDATVTRFFYDVGDATNMLVDGYPVGKFILFLIYVIS